MNAGFTHLHLHSQYSLLDGAIRLQELVPKVKELGMDSVAVTDHGNMFGAVDFYKTAKKHGVKPVMGCEAYVAGPKGRKDRTDRSNAHMVLLAKDNEGYKNLSYLVSMGFLEGFFYKPRIDRELLRKHSKGLYATSACLGGVVNKCFLREGEAAAAEVAKEFKEIFEPGHFFLELQNNGYEEQVRANNALQNISELYDIPLVATADAHYLTPADSPAHEILMCIAQGKSLSDFRQSFKHSDELYVKSPQQMYDAFADINPQAVENAYRISQDCNVELELGTYYLPKFPIPDGFTLESYLEKVSFEGLERRIKEAKYPIDRSAYKERLEYELGVINTMGFPGYFLVVWDFIRHAQDHQIPVGPGRGSGAGSLVAYSLRITDLDPIPNDLIFERFLNPERVSMPDFDIDFCQDRRGEVIDYVSDKYGSEKVGQIVTYSQMSAKGGIKDVGRVMGLPFAEVNELTKLIPNLLNGKKVSIDKALEVEPKLTEIQKEKPIYRDVINIARALEGLNRQTGMHAAGIVIGDRPLYDFVPMCRGKDGELVTQFAKDEVEEAGLVKFDFLGLKTLTVVANAVKHVRRRADEGPTGPCRDLDIEALTFDDPKIFELIARGDTDGVFQLESSGFKELLKRLKPDRFEDIVAACALYRPGPLDAGMVEDYVARKHGKKPVTYPHAACEPILENTYGVIVYQEQVMQIAVALCGFTMGGADKLRKAMGKKKADVMAEMRQMFVDGAFEKSGMPKDEANELFTQIEKFAGYAFNKCLVGSTVVTDADTGERATLRELYESGRTPRVHALGDDWKLRPRAVTDVIDNGIKPVFELRTRQGKTITATANHPFRTLDGWTNLGDLRPGDRIAAPRRLDVAGADEMEAYQLITLAGLLSEGNTCHPSVLYFTSKCTEAVHDFVQAAERFPNTVARVDTRDHGVFQVALSTGRDCRFQPGQTPWNSTVGTSALAVDASPRRSGAFDWARELNILGKKATEKRIPERVFRLENRALALFIGRLWAGDGFIANKTQAVPYYATSSEQLARDVHSLLLRLGLPNGVHWKSVKYRGQERPGYTVHLLGDGTRRRFLNVVAPYCVGREDAVALLRADLDGKASDQSSEDTGSDVFWDEVVSIEARGMEQTFDLTVEDDHNFVANEIVVHNSHSAAYSVITYRTAFLKAYFPVEFYAALISTEMRTQENVVRYIASARERGIEILPPDINRSERDFSVVVEDGVRKILFGLGAVKGLGDSAIDAILEAREEDGAEKPFESLFEFCERVSTRKVNKKALEALIKSGAFDEFGKRREVLLGAVEPALEMGAAMEKDRESGQTSLFGGFGAPAGGNSSTPMHRDERYPEVPEWSDKMRLAAEKESLGFFVSGHPLDPFASDLSRLASAECAGLLNLANGGGGGGRFNQDASLAGIITELRERPLKSGNGRMAFARLEDLSGGCEILIFSRCFAEYEHVLKSDEPLWIKGAVHIDGDDETGKNVKLRANQVVLLSEVRASKARRMELAMEVDLIDEERLKRLKELLRRNPGDVPARLRLTQKDRFETLISLPDHLRVTPTEELLGGVNRLFGKRVVHLS